MTATASASRRFEGRSAKFKSLGSMSNSPGRLVATLPHSLESVAKFVCGRRLTAAGAAALGKRQSQQLQPRGPAPILSVAVKWQKVYDVPPEPFTEVAVKRGFVSVLLLASVACATNTSPSPTPTPTSVTIAFGGLPSNCPPTPPNPSCAVTTYTEAGFTVLATAGNWVALTTYGNPAPFIEFFGTAGVTVLGGIQVTAGGATFSFKSVDIYSSVTPIPYTITGLRNSTTAFTVAATQPNTFGNFATVVNPQPTIVIDTLVISLSNPVAQNPMGVDNIVVTH
jgi:hypothetical protein